MTWDKFLLLLEPKNLKLVRGIENYQRPENLCNMYISQVRLFSCSAQIHYCHNLFYDILYYFCDSLVSVSVNNSGPGRYSDRSLFRQVVIPTGRYSDRSLFRQVDIPTNRSLFRQVVIPTGRYSDRSLFRQVDIPTNRSLFRQVVIPTGR